MPTEMQCPDCLGKGQKVDMRPVKFGHPQPLYQACPGCDGTGKVPYPKPAKVWRRKSMRRVT
jgi:DnaJ-class molecular chaperone